MELEVVGNIYQTKNYKLFKYVKENRKIDEYNKEEIKESIIKRGQLCPVICGPHHEILDGQHRFEVCVELGLPVMFIQIDSEGIEDVYTMNNVSKKWTLHDSLDSGVARGDINYMKVKACYDENELNITTVVKILAQGRYWHGSGRKKLKKSGQLPVIDKFKFQNGYEVDHENYERNRENLRMFSEVFSYIKRHQDVTAGAFFNYMINNLGYDHQRMLSQLQKHSEITLEKHEFKDTVIGKIRMLAKIYNYNKKDKKVFYVEQIV